MKLPEISEILALLRIRTNAISPKHAAMIDNSHSTLALSLALLLAGIGLAPGQLNDLDDIGEIGGGETSGVLEDVEEAIESVQIESLETTYDQQLGIARARGEVVISYQGTKIYASEAEYHQNTGDIFARDNVSIFKNGQVFRGDEAVYNTNTGVIVANGIRGGMDPLYYETADANLPSEDIDVIRTKDTFITTHDVKNPNYKIKARQINIYPEDYIVFKHAVIHLGKVPVMYLPFLAQPVDDELGYFFTPGYSDGWGGFILNQYGFLISDHTLATAQLDYRSERGLAGGLELESMRHKENDNFGRIYYYHAQDNAPNQNAAGLPRPTNFDAERYRLNVQHRVYLPGPEESSLYLDVDVNKLSDELFYLDFFPSEFRDDPRPDNLVNLVKNHPIGTISLLGRFQLNDFFRTDTRKPELALDFTRQSLFDTNLFYEGFSSYAILEELISEPERFAAENRLGLAQRRVDQIGAILPENRTAQLNATLVEEADLLGQLNRQLDERAFDRFTTYHQLAYPTQLGGWLNIVPRAGWGYARYDEIQGNGFTLDSVDRNIVNIGADISTKFSKTYPGVQRKGLGLNEVRHIIQPYTRYSYVSADDLGTNFPAIDRLAPSTKLRPLDLPRYVATDSITDWNIIRVGTYNRLQTKRNQGAYPWLELNTFMEFYPEDPEFDREYSNLFNELRWVPLPWLTLIMDSQIPLGDDFDFTEVNTYATFQPFRNFSFSIGHFFLDEHPFFLDSSNLRFSTYTRLTDNWGLGTAHFYEFTDGTLELQQYTLHRDLSSWTVGFGAQIRDNRIHEEFGVVFSLTLKAFPRLGMPIGFYGSGGGTQNSGGFRF